MLSSSRVFRAILVYCRPYALYLALGLAGIIASQALAVTIPAILRYVIDRGVALNDRGYMLQAGIFVAFLGLLRGLAAFSGRYFTESSSHRVAYDIRNDLYNKVQSLPFSYHDGAKTGALITRGISDVDEVQRFIAFGILDGLNTSLVVLFSFVVMAVTSPILTLTIFLPMALIIWRSRDFAEFVEREWRRVMEKLSKLGEHLQETIIGAEVVRAFAREDYEIRKFADENEALFHQQLKVVNRWARFIPFSAMMTAVCVMLTLIMGGWMEREGRFGVTAGVIVQFNAYLLLMSQPVRFSGFVIMLINQGLASGRRIFEVLYQEDTLVQKPDAFPLPRLQGTVTFEGVSFRYKPEAAWALRHVDLHVEAGQVIGLLGATGSGKSSFVNLIPRFYDVTEGRVLVDGYDVRDVELASLRRQVGMVLQVSLLFSATIRENIAFGIPSADEEAIIAAAKAANAHDFIMSFPQGYDTRVGERGITLSGGQRQRVAIARALLTDPRILILDDATSSVDTKTEALIQQALDNLMRGRTTFIVAQRLSSVLKADKIIVLDKGQIVEQGTHDSLIAQNGIYAQLYHVQMADQDRLRRETSFFVTRDLSRLAGD